MVQWYGQAEKGQVCLPLVPGSWNGLKMDSAWELGCKNVDQLAAKWRGQSTFWGLGELAGDGEALISQTCTPPPFYTEAASGEPDGGGGDDQQEETAACPRPVTQDGIASLSEYRQEIGKGGIFGEDHLPSATLASPTTGVSHLNCRDRKERSKPF